MYIVSGPSAGAAEQARVERWLRAAAEKDPKSSPLAAALAHVQYLQGRFEAAEAVYRKAIEANPRDTMALNNLAYLTVLRGGDAKDALRRVEAACAIAGPRPHYLHTRAVIRLKLGDTRQAIRDLTDAVAEAPSASAYFYLAQARWLEKDRKGAEAAWRHAHEVLKLKPTDLHPLERPAYEELARHLGRATASR
jgi:tetratricopeptide (TPR) repeat protein